MFASLSEAQCLGGYLVLTGSSLSGLVATRDRPGQPSTPSFIFREVLATGCVVSYVSACFNFTDVAKVRMQAAASSGGVAGGSGSYSSFRSTVSSIVAEEGLKGLVLPGIVASLLRDLSYSGLSIGMYPSMKQLLFGRDQTQDVGLARKFLTGMASGALFSGFVNPADLVKIRVQAEAGKVGENGVLMTGLRAGHPPQHQNSLQAFINVGRAEGAGGLYRGTGATMARAALGRGAQLSSYDHTKYLLKKNCGMREGVPLHALGSFLSGLAFTTASAPADIIKTRLMADTSSKYRGSVDCLLDLLRVDGPSALFRGWTPSATRIAPHFTIVGVLMEQVRWLVGVGYFAS